MYGTVIENLEIADTASEGVCIGYHEGKVVFVPFTVPGDIADVMLVRSKKKYANAFLRTLHKAGESRIEPMCSHFTLCGGCRWQHMKYEAQLTMKQKQVTDNLQRLGGLDIEKVFPISASPEQFHYRNKLEFTYADTRWLTDSERQTENAEPRGLGFHLPGRFDKIFKVDRCHLQNDYMNTIRNTALEVALKQDLTFCNRKEHTGFLRNLMIRNSSAGHWMVTVIVGNDDQELISNYMNALKTVLPEVQSWIYIVNTKANDSLNDLDFHVFSGPAAFTETMEHLHFSVGPLSFYQVNVPQALAMYRMVRQLADLKGNETVYDLYTGTGTIALFVAPHAAKVVGIEYVPTAI
ncbi:MAG TPA: 23S rRNA (uracil(1939)-C(5))-methyltransferase RlmD, partial [Bacteroidales bacterium]|nr:23S rRNA (uracil(1939)-C(5))-methyltransferase RlmD [Bacteroidales bacterium]